MKIDTSIFSITGNTPPEYKKILTPGAVLFLKSMHLRFNSTRKELLAKRKIKQKEIDSGVFPAFLSETKHKGGLRVNISVGIQYIASWLRGKGAALINHLMEDAATAEISRAQVWQWIRHPKGILNDGRKVTFELA